MSFFVTSVGNGDGANLGGLAGADAHCQALAAAVGAGDKTWHAYLSTQAANGQPAVNARDRIGSGPWYHGSDHFYGHVDHNLDYRKGYHGATPARGAAPAEHRAEFHGQAMHDVHGLEAPRGHK